MAQLKSIVRSLMAQRAVARATVDKLDRAIEALSEVNRRGAVRRAGTPRPRRRMSLAARRRISVAARARWAKIKAAGAKSLATKA
jgi:plasmid stabilization system protein ParE